MKLPSVLKQLWHNLQLMDFHAKRESFYLELAASIRFKEQFRVFLVEEFRISTARHTRNSSRAYALKLMLGKLGSGERFQISHILGAVMPKSDQLILSALDSSRDLEGTLQSLAKAIERQREARATILKAIFPPLILIPGVAGFCYVLATQSLPIIVKIAPPEVWTPFNEAVRLFSEAIYHWSIPGLISISILIAAYLLCLPRWTGVFRARFESLPKSVGVALFPVAPYVLPLNIYRDFQLSMLLTSMAVLLNSGATLSAALDVLRERSSPWMRWHLTKVKLHLEVAPTDYVNAFSKGLMSPRMLAKLATVIRTRPQFDQVLVELGTDGNQQIQQEIASTAKTINLMMFAMSAAIVIFLYVGQLSISQTMSEVLDPIHRMRSTN